MNDAVALLVNLNFWFIGALPFVFFRRDGSLNLRWWLTALPLFVAPTAVATVALLRLQVPFTYHFGFAQDAVAVLCASTSIALITFALGTHRSRLALWHQNNDAPQSIVTTGAYGKIRHPFYTSFLLGMAGALAALPHPVMAFLVLWIFIALNVTAAGEEKRLSRSEFGGDYIRYIQRTGRFFPRFGRIESASPALDG